MHISAPMSVTKEGGLTVIFSIIRKENKNLVKRLQLTKLTKIISFIEVKFGNALHLI